VQRRLGVDELALIGLDLDGQHVADVALGQQALQGRIDLERVRRRHELLDELRRSARGLEHRARLGHVHRHARLAEHVLTVLEHRPRDLAVRVGPGADAHRVDVGGPHQLAPVGIDARDVELAPDPLAGLLGPVGHRDELDSRLGLELGNVMLARIGAGADEPHADRSICHGAAW
jgi:hypothetical protein